MLGVFEWVDDSQTLRLFLENEFKEKIGKRDENLSDKNGGFVGFNQYLNKISPNTPRFQAYKTLLMRPEE
jgi:hypothetical protein